MSRDLSLKAIKRHGKFVRCQICKKHNAVASYAGLLVCRNCFRPLAYGFFAGRVTHPFDKQMIRENGPQVFKTVMKAVEKKEDEE